ncbi:hypothetical protein EDD85DRAFT_791075 [Armillaria nabsnona]|nr:hypothetical protein EDD85DRAFT_791075 [Armillaria nabsnona]
MHFCENTEQTDLKFLRTMRLRVFIRSSLESVNFVIGDGVVIWRVWVLWNPKRWILIVSTALLLTTLGENVGPKYVGAIGVVQSFATALQDVSVFDNRTLTACGLAFIASTLTTNI